MVVYPYVPRQRCWVHPPEGRDFARLYFGRRSW